MRPFTELLRLLVEWGGGGVEAAAAAAVGVLVVIDAARFVSAFNPD